jgi:hypothetical protein
MTYINDSMRAAVGRVTARQVSYPVSESDIRRWARAVYWPEVPPRLFWDKEYAERSRHGGIVAPEEFNAFAWMVAEKDDPPSAVQLAPIDPNRMEKLLGIEPPPVQNQLNGGMEVTYGVRMRPGDVVTSVTRLAEYQEREGRHGLMLFTFSEDTWTNHRGEMVKRTRSNHIRY